MGMVSFARYEIHDDITIHNLHTHELWLDDEPVR